MNMLRNLIFGAVALAGLATVSPVLADEITTRRSSGNENSHHYVFQGTANSHHSALQQNESSHHYVFHGGHYSGERYYYHGPGFVYTSPYYNYDPYWYPPIPVYGYQPGFTIALGGFPWFHRHPTAAK